MRIASIWASSPEICNLQPRWNPKSCQYGTVQNLWTLVRRSLTSRYSFWQTSLSFLKHVSLFANTFAEACPCFPSWGGFHLWGDYPHDWRTSHGSGFGLCNCSGVKARKTHLCKTVSSQHLDLSRITNFQYRLGPFGFLSTGDSEAPGISQLLKKTSGQNDF